MLSRLVIRFCHHRIAAVAAVGAVVIPGMLLLLRDRRFDAGERRLAGKVVLPADVVRQRCSRAVAQRDLSDSFCAEVPLCEPDRRGPMTRSLPSSANRPRTSMSAAAEVDAAIDDIDDVPGP